MKTVILYHPVSDHARSVEEFVHEFKRVHNQDIELMSTETREGAELAQLYDIMQYPAVVLQTDEGRMLQIWAGQPLPLMNDVASYLSS